MRIAYFNRYEVNQEIASQIASRCGVLVCNLMPHAPAPDGLFDAVLYNLDDVSKDQRSVVLGKLHRGEPVCPAAVHGYDIADEQIRSLHRVGVVASRRLHSGLIRGLIQSAQRSRAVGSADSDSTNLTWVNLVK